jgi:hypothetical protein
VCNHMPPHMRGNISDLNLKGTLHPTTARSDSKAVAARPRLCADLLRPHAQPAAVVGTTSTAGAVRRGSAGESVSVAVGAVGRGRVGVLVGGSGRGWREKGAYWWSPWLARAYRDACQTPFSAPFFRFRRGSFCPPRRRSAPWIWHMRLGGLIRRDEIFVILGEHASVFLKRFAHTSKPLLWCCHC